MRKSKNSAPSFCLGKLAATEDGRDLKFAHYRTTPLPKHPAQFGHENLVKSWGMLGNDRYGDCVFAGAAHETIMLNLEAQRALKFSDDAVLSDYAAVTGFRKNDPSTDQGTNVRDAMKYRQSTGIVDASGARHRIGAYVSIDVEDIDSMLEAIYLFGCIGIGVRFPNSAMDQFNAGKPWSVVRRSRVEGGHYVPLVAKRDMLMCVTWGKLQPVTDSFIQTYCDEAWAFISPEALTGGKSLEGFDAATLEQDLMALRS